MGGPLTSVQCIEPVTRGGKQIGTRLLTQKSRKCVRWRMTSILQIYYATANLRMLDGSIPPHKDHGRSVHFFTVKGKRKFWLKASTPGFGYTLDKVVCPFLSDAFWPGYLRIPEVWQTPGRAGQADGCQGSRVSWH